MLAAWRRLEGLGEFGAEGGEELAAGGEGGVGGASAADEDDAGGEGVGALADHAIGESRCASAKCRSRKSQH